MDAGASAGPQPRFVQATPEQQTLLVEGMLSALRPVLTSFVAQQMQQTGGRSDAARHVLRRKHRAWELTFEGEQTALGDETGLWYVDYLLKFRPGEFIHGVELAARVLGRPVLQEGNLHEDQRLTLRRIEAGARECKAVLDDPTATESEKEEALIDLERLAAARQTVLRERAGAGASKCVEAIRKSIRRLHDGIAEVPDAVLQGFARHIKRHILEPSARFATHPQGRQRAGVAGCFVYERPPGVVWEG